jgi:hypothetical protein
MKFEYAAKHIKITPGTLTVIDLEFSIQIFKNE